MSDCIKKDLIDKIMCDIKVLDLNLKYWLENCDNLTYDSLKNSDDVTDFINFKLDNIDILDCNEINNLVVFDKQVSSQLMTYDFEKNILLKRKNLAIHNLDILSIVELSKLIDDVDLKVVEVKKNVENHVNKYSDMVNQRLTLYNNFVNDINNCKSIKQLHKKSEYNPLIVKYYRLNKIFDFIISEYNDNRFDINTFFDNSDIKNLLKYDYFKVKQKVGVYVGANS